MKKFRMFVVLIGCVLALSFDIGIIGATSDFYTIRPIAGGVNNIVGGVSGLVDAMNGVIVSYGPDVIIQATQAGDGLERTMGNLNRQGWFQLKKGPVVPGTGIAAQRNFEYVAIFRNYTSRDIECLYYFNISDGEILIFSNPSWFDSGVPEYVTALEVWCGVENGEKVMKVTIDDNGTSPTRSCVRMIVRQNEQYTKVMSLANHANSNVGVTGYYSLGYIADRSMENLCVAFQGAETTAVISNNGKNIPADSVDHNPGYFRNNNGYGEKTSGGSGYPGTVMLDEIYTQMQSEAAFFTAVQNIELLAVNYNY